MFYIKFYKFRIIINICNLFNTFFTLNKVGSAISVFNISVVFSKIFLLEILSCYKDKDESPLVTFEKNKLIDSLSILYIFGDHILIFSFSLPKLISFGT